MQGLRFTRRHRQSPGKSLLVKDGWDGRVSTGCRAFLPILRRCHALYVPFREPRAVVSFPDFLATGLQPAGEQGPYGNQGTFDAAGLSSTRYGDGSLKGVRLVGFRANLVTALPVLTAWGVSACAGVPKSCVPADPAS